MNLTIDNALLIASILIFFSSCRKNFLQIRSSGADLLFRRWDAGGFRGNWRHIFR